MKNILVLLLLISIGSFNSLKSQSIEQATKYFHQDSLDKALIIIDALNKDDKDVKKLTRKIKKRKKQLTYDYEVMNSENIRIYGGVPTVNKNLKWFEDFTPNEIYSGVIYVDSTVSADKIIEAFTVTYQPIQDKSMMTKQMRNNSLLGSVSSTLSGDYRSAKDFAESGDADIRNQNSSRSYWSIQFIDGIRLYRFYYNIKVQAKKGRYKITIIPSGTSGYAQDHIQTEWSQLFRNGTIKPINERYHKQMKIKLSYTLDQWIKEVEKHLQDSVSDDW